MIETLGRPQTVVRDIGGETLYVVVRGNADTLTYFYKTREDLNRRPHRLGPEVVQAKFNQVRAILFGKPANETGDAGNEVKKDRKADDPESLRTIESKNLDHETRQRLIALRTTGISYLEEGWLRVNIWDRRKESLVLSSRFVPDIDAAIRMQVHILEKYLGNGKPGELEKLAGLDMVIQEANLTFSNWREATAKKKDELAERLAYIILHLERCRNDFKKAAQEQIEHALPLVDAWGRNNPGALAARTVAAINLLSKRFREIRNITPVIALRHELLSLESVIMEMETQLIALELRALARRLYYDPARTRNEDMDMAIGRILYAVSRLWPSPFYERSQSVADCLKTVKKIAWQGQYQKALPTVLVAHHLILGGLPARTENGSMSASVKEDLHENSNRT